MTLTPESKEGLGSRIGELPPSFLSRHSSPLCGCISLSEAEVGGGDALQEGGQPQ